MHLLGNEVVFGEIPPEGLEAARVVEGGAADEAGHSGHAVDAEEARDEVDAREPRAEVNLRASGGLFQLAVASFENIATPYVARL